MSTVCECIADIDWRSQNLRHLYPGMGLQLGVFGFSTSKITVIRQVHMYCSLSVKINTRETPHGALRLLMHLRLFPRL